MKRYQIIFLTLCAFPFYVTAMISTPPGNVWQTCLTVSGHQMRQDGHQQRHRITTNLLPYDERLYDYYRQPAMREMQAKLDGALLLDDATLLQESFAFNLPDFLMERLKRIPTIPLIGIDYIISGEGCCSCKQCKKQPAKKKAIIYNIVYSALGRDNKHCTMNLLKTVCSVLHGAGYTDIEARLLSSCNSNLPEYFAKLGFVRLEADPIVELYKKGITDSTKAVDSTGAQLPDLAPMDISND